MDDGSGTKEKEVFVGRWVHRISGIDAEARTADCAACGFGVPVVWKAHKKRFACKVADSKRGASRERSRRDHELRRKFGMSRKQYERMLSAQGGVCAICGEIDEGRHLAVDHCHDTEEIRGLLCSRCNTGIGLFLDSESRLFSAIAYLSRHKREGSDSG